MMEDEMVGWHHLLNRHEFEQVLGDDEAQGSLAWCSPWGCKVSDMTEWLKNNNCFYFCLVSSGVLFTTMSHHSKIIDYMEVPFTLSPVLRPFYIHILMGELYKSLCFLTLEVCSQCERRL